MNKFVTPLNEHYNNYKNINGELLPAFIKWYADEEDYKKIEPVKNLNNEEKIENFGDNWSDELDKKIKRSERLFFKVPSFKKFDLSILE